MWFAVDAAISTTHARAPTPWVLGYNADDKLGGNDKVGGMGWGRGVEQPMQIKMNRRRCVPNREGGRGGEKVPGR